MLRDWVRASGLTFTHMAQARKVRAPIVFLDQRWQHHGKYSGYLIGNGIGPALPRDDRLFPYPIRKLLCRLTADDALEQRLLLQILLRAGHAKLLHLVDGDFDKWVYEKERPRWQKTRITATFHQTPDKLEEIARSLRIGMLDGIVCVSRTQISLVQHLVPDGCCVFIPHGVDTEFFSPDPGTTPTGENPLLLTVGAHRRDFTTLSAATRIIKASRPDVRVRLIGPKDAIAAAAKDGAMETTFGINDFELRAAYREATMLLLPLEAATANNALLESMAVGVPAVITDLAAIREYTTKEAAILCPQGNPQAHADAALELLKDMPLCAQMGRAARTRALDFSWPIVSESLAAYLLGIVNRGSGVEA
jgi:glycosyltransferase involved in cell wall biosynthesis